MNKTDYFERETKRAEAQLINGLLIEQTKKTDRAAVLGYMVLRSRRELDAWIAANSEWDITGNIVSDFSL